MPIGKRAFFVAGTALGLIYVALGALAFVKQRAIVFPAPPPREPTLPDGRIVRIAAPAREVFALHLPAKDADAPTLVFFHGNGEQLADLPDLMRAFAAHGLGTFAIEYPGYGLAKSQSISESAIYEAGEAGIRHLEKELGVPRERIVLMGHSIGTGAATEMARRGLGAKLVLISPYTSIVDMANFALPIFPGRLLVRDRFDNADKATHIALPVLIVHGTADEVIPVAMGKKLAQLFPNVRLELIEGGHHNDLLFGTTDELPSMIARFVFPSHRP